MVNLTLAVDVRIAAESVFYGSSVLLEYRQLFLNTSRIYKIGAHLLALRLCVYRKLIPYLYYYLGVTSGLLVPACWILEQFAYENICFHKIIKVMSSDLFRFCDFL